MRIEDFLTKVLERIHGVLFLCIGRCGVARFMSSYCMYSGVLDDQPAFSQLVKAKISGSDLRVTPILNYNALISNRNFPTGAEATAQSSAWQN